MLECFSVSDRLPKIVFCQLTDESYFDTIDAKFRYFQSTLKHPIIQVTLLSFMLLMILNY